MSGSSGLPAPVAVPPAVYFDAAPLTTAVETPRELGFWSALALVMGSMVGSGVFLLPASLAAYGGLSLAGWLISAVGSVALALVFARLASHFPAHGGVYAYSRRGFGDTVGFLVAWGYWLSIVAALAALAVAGVGYLDPFVPALTRTPAAAGLVAVAVIWGAVAINIVGVGLAGRVQIATTVLKLVPLAVVGIGGLVWFDGAAFALPDTTVVPAGPQIIAVVTLTLFAFQGMECATIPAGRVVDPARTIPRATVWGTIATAVVYIVCTVGVMSLVPRDALATSTAPFADGARRMFGEFGARIVALGAALSCLGALNGWVLAAGQLPVAVAADGLVPARLGRLNRRGTPGAALVVAGVLASVLVAMNYSRGLVGMYTAVVLLSTLTAVIAFVFCALAVWVMPGHPAPAGMAAVVSGVAFVYALAAVAGAGAETVYAGFLMLLAGLPLFVWVRRSQGRLAPGA
jgi:basic amino acid/polyamine antiporter, APA family